ncbi:TackOD1 domain-containing metal-binding protein [Legionella clemsonensis]|uniref:GGDEF domain protein n=1 Tax=Legionella clemsonensis TaxID=1867846 RepID=A0A222P2H0_9GAMM|nr:diguanylate cyclase [Legionella clemsonensis]ASQ46054.1 GGDEF domain protein [Legionella clemsonensis]
MDDQIVWIIGSPKELDLPCPVRWVSSDKELPEKACFALALDLNLGHNYFELLAILRQRKPYRFTPIFYLGQLEEDDAGIFDGQLGKDSPGIALAIHERLSLIPLTGLLEDQELFLLSYLFTRSNLVIHGYLTPHSAKGIYFPLLQVLFGESNSFDEWSFLQNLVSRDLLSQEKLVDEIQTCPSCHSGLLNYKNACPNCHSINIQVQQFIHCFSCGNIEPSSEFLRQERLICPRCNAKLRHIGMDYDKPLEDKLCNQCGFYFLDAEIIIICINCSKNTRPENLVSRRLYTYKLTKHGEFLARGIEKKLQTRFSNFFEFIEFDIFFAIIKWQLKLTMRYKNLHFSVLALKIVNEEELLDELGLFHTEKVLTEFYERLRYVFRDSDLASHGENFVLFFLPMTDDEGCEVLLKRIQAFSEEQQLNKSEKKLIVHMGFITSGEINKSKQDAEYMIANLHSRIDRYE